jgi:hypothetical protein
LTQEELKYYLGCPAEMAYLVLLYKNNFDAFVYELKQNILCLCDDRDDGITFESEAETFFYRSDVMDYIDRFWEHNSEAYNHLLPKHVDSSCAEIEMLTPVSDQTLFIEVTPI